MPADRFHVPAVFGKTEADRKQQQPIRTNNDNPFRVSLSARQGCFRLEFQHKTSTVLHINGELLTGFVSSANNGYPSLNSTGTVDALASDVGLRPAVKRFRENRLTDS